MHKYCVRVSIKVCICVFVYVFMRVHIYIRAQEHLPCNRLSPLYMLIMFGFFSTNHYTCIFICVYV